jgi:hypothetical protein
MKECSEPSSSIRVAGLRIHIENKKPHALIQVQHYAMNSAGGEKCKYRELNRLRKRSLRSNGQLLHQTCRNEAQLVELKVEFEIEKTKG